MIEEVELPESVYNSNAIENSTLSLSDTEKILLHQEIPAHRSKREVFEAENLAAVTAYLTEKAVQHSALTADLLCLVHGTLLHNIHKDIAGRFRHRGEYVRVGPHIAPPPEEVPRLIKQLLQNYSGASGHPLDRVIHYHLEFERIHPFCDGNGRVGRAILNFQLKENGYPPIIIQNKEKRAYYRSLDAYDHNRDVKLFERIVGRLVKESFHKRLTYLRGDEVVLLADIARKHPSRSPQSITNAAKRQFLPAFRERGHWKVGKRAFVRWISSTPPVS
jgi:Fic family protein